MDIPLSAGWTAVVYGLVLACSLIVGGALAAGPAVPRRVVGASLAFASGALIAAIGLELVFVPFTKVGAAPVVAGVAVGAVVFAGIDLALDRLTGRGGWGLVLEQASEGVPESLAVGATAGSAGLALFVSVALANVPEAMSGVVELRERDIAARKGVLAWTATGALLFVATMCGFLLGRYVGDGPTAVLHAGAGGAALAGVSSEIMPEAYERGGLWVTLATVAGFLLAFWLFTLSFESGSA